jgi:hypothetical protein
VYVTGDEVWVSSMNVETKEQSKQGIHHSANKTKFKQKEKAWNADMRCNASP